MDKSRAASTIQHYAFQRLKADFDLVFNDDGSGEAADLVGLKEVDEKTIRRTHPTGAVLRDGW
ncbi:hypothetical protein ACVWZZ_005670 [Bradyrhizobium sp. LM6.10]